MNRRPQRHALTASVIAVLALAVILFDSSTSVPSIPSPMAQAPSQEEILALEELAQWVRGDTQVTIVAPSRQTLTGMADAMRQGRRSFELFRSYTGPDAHRDYLAELPYGAEILAASDLYGLDPLLVAAVVETESGFHPHAVSPKGALGLMQVLPSTGSMYGVANLTDPAANLTAGARYFADLLEYFSGDLELAIAAYNAGPGNVRRYGGVPPFQETRSYVRKVLDAYFQNHWAVWNRSGADQQILLH